MTLKAFHILFIALSILLAWGFGIWCVQSHFLGNDGVYLGMGIVSFGAGIGLVFYGVWFLKKLKQMRPM